jgi:hypothetical protein
MDHGTLESVSVTVKAKLIDGEDRDVIGSFVVDAEGGEAIQRKQRSRGQLEYDGPVWCDGVRYHVKVPVFISRTLKDKASERPRYTGQFVSMGDILELIEAGE